MNFSPISGYNNFLKNNAAFDVDAGFDFENILAQQTNALSQNQPMLKGTAEINTDFNSFFVENASASSQNNSSTDSFMSKIGNSFGGGLKSVNDNAVAAEKAQEALAMGENVSVHDVMIASEKSALSMQMAMQLRNKLLNAYSEINNVKV